MTIKLYNPSSSSPSFAKFGLPAVQPFILGRIINEENVVGFFFLGRGARRASQMIQLIPADFICLRPLSITFTLKHPMITRILPVMILHKVARIGRPFNKLFNCIDGKKKISFTILSTYMVLMQVRAYYPVSGGVFLTRSPSLPLSNRCPSPLLEEDGDKDLII